MNKLHASGSINVQNTSRPDPLCFGISDWTKTMSHWDQIAVSLKAKSLIQAKCQCRYRFNDSKAQKKNIQPSKVCKTSKLLVYYECWRSHAMGSLHLLVCTKRSTNDQKVSCSPFSNLLNTQLRKTPFQTDFLQATLYENRARLPW